MDTPIREIETVKRSIAMVISNMRKGKISIEPGYDGEFGKVMVP
jgi:PHP family Zn ribbon phosphoesterase